MTPPPSDGPERDARRKIDEALSMAGWAVQDRDAMNLAAARGVAVRGFKMKEEHGFADCLLFFDDKPVGVVEAKPVGHTLSGAQTQARKYSDGLPDVLSPPLRPAAIHLLEHRRRDPLRQRTRPRAPEPEAVLLSSTRDARRMLVQSVEGWRSHAELAMLDVVIPGAWANNVETITAAYQCAWEVR